MLKYKYTEAILSNSTRKLLCFEITKMLSLIIICGTPSFPIVKNSLVLTNRDWPFVVIQIISSGTIYKISYDNFAIILR